jgi:hypothetical protein
MAEQAVYIRGVGNTVAHNHLHNAPHQAIYFEGNNHLIEYNDIHDVGRVSSDAGAIYTGRSWSWLGTEIRYNYIHHLTTWFSEGALHGVYIDDCSPGVYIHGNVFNDVAYLGILAGGGYDVLMENNIFIQMISSLAGDNRCTGTGWTTQWPRGLCVAEPCGDAPDYRSPPWSNFPLTWTLGNGTTVKPYESLAKIPPDVSQTTAPLIDGVSTWMYPNGSVWARNLSFNVPQADDMGAWGAPTTYGAYLNYGGESPPDNLSHPTVPSGSAVTNFKNVDPQFVDLNNIKLGLKSTSPLLAPATNPVPNWHAIDFSKIGPE